MTKKEFLEKPTESNEEWVALQILGAFNARQFASLRDTMKKLDETLYKSWAKYMPLSELMEAIRIVDELEK